MVWLPGHTTAPPNPRPGPPSFHPAPTVIPAKAGIHASPNRQARPPVIPAKSGTHAPPSVKASRQHAIPAPTVIPAKAGIHAPHTLKAGHQHAIPALHRHSRKSGNPRTPYPQGRPPARQPRPTVIPAKAGIHAPPTTKAGPHRHSRESGNPRPPFRQGQPPARHSRESRNPRIPLPSRPAASTPSPRKRESRTLPANAGILGQGAVDSRFRGNDVGGGMTPAGMAAGRNGARAPTRGAPTLPVTGMPPAGRGNPCGCPVPRASPGLPAAVTHPRDPPP